MTNQRKMEVSCRPRHKNSCIQAKCAAKKEISKAKEEEGTKFGEKLDIDVGKRLVF